MFVSKLFHFRYYVPKVLCCQTVNLFQNLSFNNFTSSLAVVIVPEGIFLLKMAQRNTSNYSPPEGGVRMRPDLYTDEEVTTGKEGAQAVREFATDWLDLESHMAEMSVDDKHHGKVLPIC